MEVLLEVIFEFLFQFLFELVLEGAFRGLARPLRNRIVRAVLGVGLALAVGYGGGFWWGSRLTESGRTQPPKSLWVSIGLAVLFGTVTAVQALRREPKPAPPLSARDRLVAALTPWRWSVVRLLGFALFNAAIATGIAAGFEPRPLR